MSHPTTARRLGKRFRKAMAFAAKAHKKQARKGGDIPYTSHLLAVTSIVLDYGGDEDQAIAALLHDVVEDQGGAAMRAEVLEKFGERVTEMVDDCTDADETPKPPWIERKQAYIAHIQHAHVDSLLVSMADKLHNTESIVRDVRHFGPTVFDRFSAEPEQVAWYYRSLVQAFESRGLEGDARALLVELRRAVRELEQGVADFD